jgi:hypothetical protein
LAFGEDEAMMVSGGAEVSLEFVPLDFENGRFDNARFVVLSDRRIKVGRNPHCG